jgi:hypothetical protein
MNKNIKKEITNINDYISKVDFTGESELEEELVSSQDYFLTESFETHSKEMQGLIIGKPIRVLIKATILKNG